MEQRGHTRYDLRMPFALMTDGETLTPVGETRNLSSAGVYFTSNRQLSVGDPIEYSITFPKAPGDKAETLLRCVGVVVRQHSKSFAATIERYEFVREPNAFA